MPEAKKITNPSRSRKKSPKARPLIFYMTGATSQEHHPPKKHQSDRGGD
jgi:hypothetical protein